MRNDLKLDIIVEELAAWLDDPEPARFPYDAVVTEYHRTGKHFVSESLLKTLALARKEIKLPNSSEDTTLLCEFLRSALDKWDGYYEYTTYLTLSLLPMPTMEDMLDSMSLALQRRDRLVVQLLADLVSFELAFADGRTNLLPMMRPNPHITAKRCRLAVHGAIPILQRLGLACEVTVIDPVRAARKLCETVLPYLSVQSRRILQLSMLPVYVAHDEYLFIRVLQMFETTFALLATMLHAAVHALTNINCIAAVRLINAAESTLHESAPMFSLLATMQPESFRTFREFTEGASAIQSRNYKTVEALCSKPETDRLNSVAYFSVPEVRNWVFGGNATLDDAFRSVSDSQWLTTSQLDMLSAAMSRFSATLMRWRQTHYRLAIHMLGECVGTGYTQGASYLKLVRTIPVFQSIEHSERGDSVEPI